jgi:hypothetical protein
LYVVTPRNLKDRVWNNLEVAKRSVRPNFSGVWFEAVNRRSKQ